MAHYDITIVVVYEGSVSVQYLELLYARTLVITIVFSLICAAAAIKLRTLAVAIIFSGRLPYSPPSF